MDKETLRGLVFEILRKSPQTHLHAIENEIRRRREDYTRGDSLTLSEIVWELLVQGVLAPGKNSLNLNLPFVHATEYGSRSLEEGSIISHDPDGYVRRLIEHTGGRADRFTVETAREAALCFTAGRYQATIVILARAAEHLFDLLAGAIIEMGRRTGRGTKRIESAGRRPEARYREIHRILFSKGKTSLGEDELEPHIAGLHNVIILSRTEEGEPRIPVIDGERARGYLLLLPEGCRSIYRLIDILNGRSSG
jgi:hypothetical protein